MVFYVSRINTVTADALFFHLLSSLLSSVNVLLSSVRSFEIDFFSLAQDIVTKIDLKTPKKKPNWAKHFYLSSSFLSLVLSLFLYFSISSCCFFLVHSIVVNVIAAEWQWRCVSVFFSASLSKNTSKKGRTKRTITTQIRILLRQEREKKKHVITDLMCRIPFITIHENVWLDSSKRYCHLLRSVCRLRCTFEMKRTQIRSCHNWIHVIFGICFSFCGIYCDFFGDMRSDVLWFFFLTTFGLCTTKRKKNKNAHNH